MEPGRLKRHELTHDKLEQHEGFEVKVRPINLKSKYESDQEEEFQFEEGEDDALIKKFEKFLRKVKTKENTQSETSTSRKKINYFECG